MAEHQFKEKFALMWYACKCGHRERIWNSRNGVTPFCTTCPSCGQADLQHDDWHLDQEAPNHVLFNGQRYWADYTKKRAKQSVDFIKAMYEERNMALPAHILAKFRSDAEKLEGDYAPGRPCLYTFNKVTGEREDIDVTG